MRCSGSPTTSTAADADTARIVTATVDAIVFREILKPLAAGLGPLGESVVDAVADRAFAPAVRPR